MSGFVRSKRRLCRGRVSRLLALIIPLAFGGLAIGCNPAFLQAGGTGSASIPAVAGPDAASAAFHEVSKYPAAVFPLAVKPGKRYLVDAAGKPFLIHGDTAWSLIAELTREEVDQYLDDRRSRGFNTILVSLLEAHYSTNPPANAYGQLPFRGLLFEAVAWLANLLPSEMSADHRMRRMVTLFADYSTPNEEYFSYADWVLRRAAEKGFLVLLTPSYIGCCSDGWYRAMAANGPERLRQYGEYLGRRYRDFTNILWVHAGDANPPDKDLVRAIAEGIHEFDPHALHTAHGAPGTAALDYWEDEPWLQVSNVYTYDPVYAPAIEHYMRPERLPFFLIESAYENEHGASEQRLRTQAYQAVLSGAVGQIFGNNPIWHFDGPGNPDHGAPATTWQGALDSRGAQSMTHLREFLTRIRWWELEPDIDNSVLTDGLGPDDERAVAASTVDRSLAVIYLPTNRDITVDLRRFAGSEVAARWFDPANGQFSAISGSPFPTTESRQFRPEFSNNSSGFDDWVLILEAQA